MSDIGRLESVRIEMNDWVRTCVKPQVRPAQEHTKRNRMGVQQLAGSAIQSSVVLFVGKGDQKNKVRWGSKSFRQVRCGIGAKHSVDASEFDERCCGVTRSTDGDYLSMESVLNVSIGTHLVDLSLSGQLHRREAARENGDRAGKWEGLITLPLLRIVYHTVLCQLPILAHRATGK